VSPELSYPSVAIFGGEYNAKGLELRRLVERFVPPKMTFGRLLQGNNTVLVGPRGSGKTTLMMMLQSAALELYSGPEAERFRSAVNYTGVLVPGDQTWAKQLDALQMNAEGGELFAVSVFTLHCLRALTRAALERTRPAPDGVLPYRRFSIDYGREQQLARAVASAWRLGRPVADLEDLVAALDDAILDVTRLRSELAHQTTPDRDARIAAEPLLHLDMIPAAVSLVERFNTACSEPAGRWAFLFDEAELVPPVINRLIVRLLRGTDGLFLFKVSYAPYENVHVDFAQPHGAQEGNDFTTLRLTYANKREAFPFTEELLRFRLRERHGPEDPDEVLGTTSVVALDAEMPEQPAGMYAPGSAYGKLLVELADKDPSFAEWLAKNRIFLEHAHELEEELRARLRKVMPIVALRVAYLRDPARPAGTRRLRGRRNVSLYSGKEAFYSMMEANPRWLNHVCDRLLEGAGDGMIAPGRQSRHLLDAAEEFESYLRILPVRGTHLEMNDAPKRLLHRIAEFFREQYIGGPFTADPCGSFVVDREFSDTVLRSLRALINRGALVEVPAGGGLGELVGTRFRCAYIVAPIYGLPLRLDKPVTLSSILAASPYQQMTLGEDEEEET
jgi:energy-coupling factor transporter ATP-binding protein EcfA2